MAFPLSDEEHGSIKNRIDNQLELIIAAAVRVDGVIVFRERPGRHADAINFLHHRGIKDHDDHGFVTNRGRFVNRQEAAKIVAASNQGSTRNMGPGYERALFSEDMWNDFDIQPTEVISPKHIF